MIRQFQPEVVALAADLTLDPTKYPSGTVFLGNGHAVALPTLSNVRSWRGYYVDVIQNTGSEVSVTSADNVLSNGSSTGGGSLFTNTAGDTLRVQWTGAAWYARSVKGDDFD